MRRIAIPPGPTVQPFATRALTASQPVSEFRSTIHAEPFQTMTWVPIPAVTRKVRPAQLPEPGSAAWVAAVSHAKPDGPWGPCAPSAPAAPGGPCGPGTVESAPGGPCAPVAPAGPCGPVAPAPPGVPCGPCGPCGPGDPAGPG